MKAYVLRVEVSAADARVLTSGHCFLCSPVDLDLYLVPSLGGNVIIF